MVCVRTVSGSWKISYGKKRAQNGSDTVSQVHLRWRWFQSFFWSLGTCPPAPLHLVLQTGTLKGIEVLVKSHDLGPILGDVTFIGCRTLSGSEIRAFFASPMCASSAVGLRGSDRFMQVKESLCQATQNLCKEAVQLFHLKLSKSPVPWRLQDFYCCHFLC